MSLPSHHLDAFFEVCRTRNFTTAARNLHITQSALSQRIQSLEETLETTLLVRDRTGIRITEAGERLLRYCQVRERLEEETLGELRSRPGNELTGTLRIAAYSSVLRSVLLPSLSSLFSKHPKIQCHFESYEMSEIENILIRGEADFAVLDFESKRQGLKSEILGKEEYVLIESKRTTTRNHIYLDHDPTDQATFDFFRSQGKKAPMLQRAYFGDVYGILDAVELGYGRAVMSKHLLKDQNVRVVSGFKSRFVDVHLTYFEQPYYSKLHQVVIEELKRKAPAFL